MDLKFVQYAEEKVMAGKVEDALKLARMAARLNPERSSEIDQFITVYSIHLAAGRKVGNWYDILGVADKKADTETIKKRFKKLALAVHPDKNASAAAEGAFKFISDAWNVLSNPITRKAYDARCTSRPRKGAAPPPPPPPPPPPRQGFGRPFPRQYMGDGWSRINLSAI